MPIHDWTRVASGTFHAFHTAWIAQLQEWVNAGQLAPDYGTGRANSDTETSAVVSTVQEKRLAPVGGEPAGEPQAVAP